MEKAIAYLEGTKAGIDSLIGKLKAIGRIEEALVGAKAAPKANGKPKAKTARKTVYRGLWGQYAKLTKGIDKDHKKKLDAVRQAEGLKAAVAAAKKVAGA